MVAARRAIDQSGTNVLLTGRSEGFVYGRPDIDETIRRLVAYAEAGADCLYAPRIDNLDHVSAIVAAVSPKPVNLLINAPFTTVAEAAQLGVRRISVGGTLARTAWDGFLKAAGEIAEAGTFPGSRGSPMSKHCSADGSTLKWTEQARRPASWWATRDSRQGRCLARMTLHELELGLVYPVGPNHDWK